MKVTIIGAAGSVGAPVAFYLGATRSADEIVLVDVRQNVVQQHAMDMSTAFSSIDVTVRTGGYGDLAGSDVIIVAAGAAQGVISDRMEMLAENLPTICDLADEIKRRCPAALIITATNPVDPLNYAMCRAGGFDRGRAIGYSLNDSLRFREMVARAKGVRPSDVEGVVIGEHGSTQVPLFSSVRIDGRPVTFDADEKNAIRDEIPNILKRYEELQAGRTAGWTCAIGIVAVVRAMVEDSGATFACSVVLDGEYGLYGLSMSVPVRLGREGVREILEQELAPDEKEGLTQTARVLALAARQVEESLA